MLFYFRHEIAEVAGLTAMSFGQEGVDRYIVVYKRDKPPTEDEIAARREGEEWNEAKAQEYEQNVSTKRVNTEYFCYLLSLHVFLTVFDWNSGSTNF